MVRGKYSFKKGEEGMEGNGREGKGVYSIRREVEGEGDGNEREEKGKGREEKGREGKGKKWEEREVEGVREGKGTVGTMRR